MTQELNNLQPAVAKTLAIWHELVRNRDFSKLASIVHPDAVFRSPMAINAYHSADALVLALSTVINVFENFAYHREFASADGLNVVLEFSAHVGDKQLKGADFVRFDSDGKIVEFEVMIRPLSGLQALGLEMGRRLGDKMPEYKVKQ